MQPSRRHVLTGTGALTLSAGLGALLTACGSGSGGSTASGPATSGTKAVDRPADGKSFPVTVQHKYGATTIKSAPKRVVCVGLLEQDSLLALGVVPVGVTTWLGAAKGEIYPWAKGKLGDSPLPKVLDSKKINIEEIAALKPDLIVAIYSDLKQADYTKLSQLAPTIAAPKGHVDWGTPWDETAQLIADALGKHDEGVKLVKSVKGDLAAAKKAHPQFVGKTAVVATPYEGAYIYGPSDIRSQIQHALGFTFPAKFKDIGGKTFGGSISAERTKEIDFDVVVWLDSPASVKSKLGGLYEQTKAYKEGRTIYVPSSVSDSKKASTYASAFSMVTPLSIPWVLKRYVPQLAAAVDGKPSTKVKIIDE
ncbi:ABC transporter substrate-binding protein [Flexivirga endophytica]|uniref:ABC transporter substrate-binding protein n=1 Tax=Flexivirga endophytica TaxID=1849103 RepID=A0A916WPB5_9MICO|nr:iron-siderophore ABC transporter substrate-binding protein [Flexivirga endophytica]GGB17628.1 ABC transporter substrate-binding protein [Flexivirga endophytica]GHB38022.1 ABC transporter substrate-binding protein [Flexivirga endophytica]